MNADPSGTDPGTLDAAAVGASTTETPARDRIMAAALDLFATHGFGSTSVKAVAARAGVSPGLIYVYFASKDDLLEAVFEEGMRDVWASLEPVTTTEPAAALEALMRRSFELVAAHEHLWRLLYALRSQPGVLERVGAAYAEWRRAIESQLTDLCARAGHADPSTSAKVLFALIDGANQHRMAEPDTYPTDAVVRVVTAAFARSQP